MDSRLCSDHVEWSPQGTQKSQECDSSNGDTRMDALDWNEIAAAFFQF
ncbi:MAG: hypothetical protein HXS49_02975 [Theionarchaea archaeon]|nr:hypothetical protein [Theionarchaea archaeon]MBU7034124.1 hypothetical protein [Theionarchaea archaeon]